MKIMDFMLHKLVASKALSESLFTAPITEPFCGEADPNTGKEEYAVTECRICYRMCHFLLRTKVHSHHSNNYYSELLKACYGDD